VGIVALCERIGLRARDAAARGEPTFGLPEAAGAASWLAARVRDLALREEAATWASAGAGYHALLSLCFRGVGALDGQTARLGAGRFRDKVEGELASALALSPWVVFFPTAETLTPIEMIELRAYPVHPLGLVDGPAWTDGAPAPPSEFFFHDLDHARFKVREDLLAAGVDVPDAYRDGSTLDPATGRHRAFLSHALGHAGGLWAAVASRAAVARRLLARVAGLDAPDSSAGELLLFELVHEKSFPLDERVLRRELSNDAHLAKLRGKAAKRFFPEPIDAATVDALPAARDALVEALS
jgi:hypothetical protein